MSQILSHRMVRTVLGALLVLAIGLSTVQAGEMALKMASPTTGDGPAMTGCADCASLDDAMDSGACLPLCAAPAMGVVPAGRALAGGHGSTPPLADKWTLGGRTLAPDPDPPRLNEIG